MEDVDQVEHITNQILRNDFNFDNEIWFENRPLGTNTDVNTLAKTMKEISKAALLFQRYTRQSVKLKVSHVRISRGRQMSMFNFNVCCLRNTLSGTEFRLNTLVRL